MDSPISEKVKPKRGRKPNKLSSSPLVETNVIEPVVTTVSNPASELSLDAETEVDAEVKQIAKKRGRKPKGGKIVQQLVSNEPDATPKQNIILHLKC